MKNKGRIAAIAVAGVLTLGLTACTPPLVRHELPAQPVSKRHARMGADGAESVEARIRMGVGRLKVSGGADTLMEADFDYRPDSWNPNVSYSLEGSRGVLTVSQPEGHGRDLGRRFENEWDVSFDETMPLDLTVEQGVGESELELGGLNLRSLTVQGGAGSTIVDLTGTPRGDLRAEIESGVGEITVRVPRDVGVKLFGIYDGLGDWQAEGFTQRGENESVNAAYDSAKVRFDISIQRGVGSVRVEQE